MSTNFDLQIDDGNMKRSMTGFDRSVGSRLFEKGGRTLKQSHNMRLSESGFFPGHPCASREFNFALRLLREWVRDKGYNS